MVLPHLGVGCIFVDQRYSFGRFPQCLFTLRLLGFQTLRWDVGVGLVVCLVGVVRGGGSESS